MQFNRKCIKNAELPLKDDIFYNEWPTSANATGKMQFINEDNGQFITKRVKH